MKSEYDLAGFFMVIFVCDDIELFFNVISLLVTSIFINNIVYHYIFYPRKNQFSVVGFSKIAIFRRLILLVGSIKLKNGEMVLLYE
jgi:hypothetical protein